MFTGINIFFAKFNIIHEVVAPYQPETNGMAERLIRLLKNGLHHVNKEQGFNLQRNFNIAMIAYHIVPHRATGYSPFVLIYGCEAVTPYKNCLPYMCYVKKYQDALSSHN